MQFSENGVDLVPSQDNWKPDGTFGPDDILNPIEVLMQDFLVEKQDGAQRLVLGRGADSAFRCQARQESADFGLAEPGWILSLVEPHEPSHPAGVSLFGAWTQMAAARLPVDGFDQALDTEARPSRGRGSGVLGGQGFHSITPLGALCGRLLPANIRPAGPSRQGGELSRRGEDEAAAGGRRAAARADRAVRADREACI